MKLLHATVAACLFYSNLACWPQRPSPQDEPIPSTSIAPTPQVSASVRSVPPQPTARASPSPDTPPLSKKGFEIFSIYPTPQSSPNESESQATSQAISQAPSPSPPETGPETEEEEVVIIPAVPTPQVIEFSGRPSSKSKE